LKASIKNIGLIVNSLRDVKFYRCTNSSAAERIYGYAIGVCCFTS